MTIKGHQQGDCTRRRTTIGVLSSFAIAMSLAACDEPTTSSPAPGDAGIADSATGGDAANQTSSDGGGQSAAETAQEKAYCDALASRSACPNEEALPCDPEGKCIYGRAMLASAAAVYRQCIAAPSCKTDDLCIYEAAVSVGGTAATTYANDCQARRSACANSFSEEDCAPILFAFDSGAAAQACLAKACDEVGTCIRNVADALKAKCN